MSRLHRPPARVWTWTAVTLVVAAVAVLLWRTSSVAATSSTTTTPAAATAGAPGTDLAQAWTAATTDAASGSLVQGGRVLTTDARGLTVRDAGTGDEAWHYRRSDARLCGATAVSDLVVAVFRTTGRCNEAVALRVGTGVRAWTRNVSYLADTRLDSAPGLVLASTPSGVTTLDATGDNTRWRHPADPGCRLVDTVAGSSGVVVLQRCGDGGDVQVQLLDTSAGKVTWSAPLTAADTPARLLGADGLVTVRVGDTVHVFSATAGAELPQLTLGPLAGGATAADEPLQQAATDDVVLLWARGTVYALDARAGTLRWQQPAVGLPAVDASAGTAGALEDGGYVVRSLTDGTEVSRATAPGGLPAGGRVAVAGGTVVYATGDRVLGLR